MFLNKLDDSEKMSFLTLAHHVARSDGDFSENERIVINTYCLEMQISDIDYNKDSFNLSEVLDNFKNNESQKIVLLEIIALVYSDGIHQEEQNILEMIMEKYNISESLYMVFVEWSKSILSISNQGHSLIKL